MLDSLDIDRFRAYNGNIKKSVVMDGFTLFDDVSDKEIFFRHYTYFTVDKGGTPYGLFT